MFEPSTRKAQHCSHSSELLIALKRTLRLAAGDSKRSPGSSASAAGGGWCSAGSMADSVERSRWLDTHFSRHSCQECLTSPYRQVETQDTASWPSSPMCFNDWISDHSRLTCRLDPVGPLGVAGTSSTGAATVFDVFD